LSFRHAILSILLCAGCERGFVVDTDDTANGDDTATDDTGDTDPETCDEGIVDPWADLDPTHCDDAIVSAATAYYIGDFTLSGESVGGTEYLVLYANPLWEAEGGEDCITAWTVESGTRGDPANCDHCEFSVTINGTLNGGETTCPPELQTPASFSVTYDVDDSGTGDVIFYFTPSGNELGRGCIGSSRITYLSEYWCKSML
jgi:hypothetical protein